MTRNNDWLILRCSSANTLRLAQSLAWASIEAWSPAVRLVERTDGNRSRRPKRIPVLGSYVFARAAHLHELQIIRANPLSPHPGFSFMHDLSGEISTCPDRQLNPLRVAEQKGQPIEQARQWQPGDQVIYHGSGFEGLVGTITRTTKKSAWVDFGLFGKASEIPAVFLLPHNPQTDRKAA
jgi:hypothetical protein